MRTDSHSATLPTSTLVSYGPREKKLSKYEVETKEPQLVYPSEKIRKEERTQSEQQQRKPNKTESLATLKRCTIQNTNIENTAMKG